MKEAKKIKGGSGGGEMTDGQVGRDMEYKLGGVPANESFAAAVAVEPLRRSSDTPRGGAVVVAMEEIRR